MNLKENLGLAVAILTLAVNIWIAFQNREPPPPGKHRKKR